MLYIKPKFLNRHKNFIYINMFLPVEGARTCYVMFSKDFYFVDGVIR